MEKLQNFMWMGFFYIKASVIYAYYFQGGQLEIAFFSK